MSLSTAQKEFIISIIEPLLELPNDQTAFMTTIEQLNQALLNTVDEEHPFVLLSKCFRSPIICFPHLEKQNSNKTYLHEVQEFIISTISQTITTHADKLKFKYQWENILAMQFCMHANNKTFLFETPMPAVDGGENPLSLSLLEGKIYTRTLRMAEQPINFANDYMDLDDVQLVEFLQAKRSLYVDVCIHCPVNTQPINESIFICDLPNDFESDEEEDAFMLDQHKKAENLAEQHAAKVALAFIEQKSLKNNSVTKLSKNLSVSKLITIPYFFNEANAHRLKISAFKELNEQESDTLANPFIIDLMKNRALCFTTAKTLTIAQRRVVTHPTYYSLFKNKTLTLRNIHNMSDQRSLFITHPNVANLILCGRMRFNQAIKIPCYALPIFKDCSYIAFFNRHPFDWDTFSNLNEAQIKLMLHKLVISNFLNNTISLNELAGHTAEKIFALRLFFSTFHPAKCVETADIIIRELTTSPIRNSYVALHLVNLIENMLTNFPVKETIKDRLKGITFQKSFTTECETVLHKLIEEANEILRDLRRNRFKDSSSSSSSSLSTMYGARKRARSGYDEDKPIIKRGRTNEHEDDEVIKTLCSKIIALANVDAIFSANTPVREMRY